MSAKSFLRTTNCATITHICISLTFLILISALIGCTNNQRNVRRVWKTVMAGDWSAHLYDVHFISETHGWIVGNSVGLNPAHSSEQIDRTDLTYATGAESIILHTTDGGENWHRQHSGIFGKPLWDVHFRNENEGWCVGEQGVVVHTKDAGKNWKKLYTSTQNKLNSIFMINAVGWIVGDWGTLLITTDSGKTFQQVHVSIFKEGSLKDIFFIDESHGWIITHNSPNDAENDGYIYHTSNGGQTWKEQFATQAALFDVHFVDRMTGWVVGDKRSLFVTKDGGNTWQYATEGSNERHKDEYGQPEYLGKEPLHTFTLYDIDFVDKQHGWIVGDLGVILHTDKGLKENSYSVWKHQRGGPRFHNSADGLLLGVDFVSKKLGWAVGENGTILNTRNGGVTWESQSNPTHLLFDVCMIGNNSAYVVGDRGSILQTNDGGTNWEAQDSRTAECFGATHFVTQRKGWAVAEAGVILRTTNGGAVWEQQTSNTKQDLLAVFFIDEETGWCVGSAGEIVYTSDGGKTWTPQKSGVPYNLFDIHFTSKKEGWIVGLFGTLLFTDDGGKRWQISTLTQQLKKIETNSNVWLNAVHFVFTKIGWVVGENGVIFNTKDGGKTWILQDSHTDNFLYDVDFISENEGWVVGKDGLILHTKDGGNNWRPQRTDTRNDLTAIHMSSHKSGIVTGQAGTILQYKVIESD